MTETGLGGPEPLGVRPVAGGIDVAIVSTAAERIEICLFDADGTERRVDLGQRTGDVWHAHVPGVPLGTRYGLRAHGPWDAARGLRFNPAKLLVDPHAVALDRVPRLHAAMFAQNSDGSRDQTDSAAVMPLGVVAAAPDDAAVARPGTPWRETIIYELHVRGFTMTHPEVPQAMRGTMAGLGHEAVVAHLSRLGVTAVEILPAAAWIEERHLPPLGLTNYWGYNPIAFLAPDPRLAPGGWPEVRATVATLARAGIETIVDVVLNHTGEGDERGPTVSLRGLDNAMYYRLADDPARYVDDTGCGNSVALDRPHVVRLAMDALRAWAAWGGVHGFRFDLAPILGRRAEGFDPAAPLLSAIAQDPLLRGLKLIAEPWDVGAGGYRLGAFPGPWGEWNDRFRDDVRRFWRGDPGMIGPLATRLAGSQDAVGAHRRPSRSINFVTAHDGFTLADLVSYAAKHNEANGEDNRDGTGDNHSWNGGVEGATDDPAILTGRRRDQIALLATLLFSRGTPMLGMGSELGHSQAGNNNAYALDSPLSWIDWRATDQVLLAAATDLIAARKRHPALSHDEFLTDATVHWLDAEGRPMDQAGWRDDRTATLVMLLPDPAGQVALVLHRGADDIEVALPSAGGAGWVDALQPGPASDRARVPARSVRLFVPA